MRPIEVIINAASGGVLENDTEKALREGLTAHGLKANISLAKNGEEITSLAKAAAEGDAEVIVAGGGDGTISAVGEEVYRANKTLGVLPLGTLNNFSKDLGIPQDISEAAAIVGDGHTTVIDLAEVNGHIFLNNSSIGLYPRIVRRREQQQERLGHGKWRAAFWAALRIFRLSPFLKVRINVDGRSFLRKTPFVFVGNNRYEMELFNMGRRSAIDEGKLSVYFLHRGGRWGVIMLLFHTLTGGVRQWSDFEEVLTDSVTIQTRRKLIQVALDGEVLAISTPLEYKILPKALKVLVPRAEDNDA